MKDSDMSTFSKAMYGTPSEEQLAARKRWVEMLRSGKYEQLAGALASPDGARRCCLGVACDPVVSGLEIAASLDEKTDTLAFESGRWFGDCDEEKITWETAALPTLISHSLGFGGDKSPAVFFKDSFSESLADLNDNGVPFAEIADAIEANHIAPFESAEVSA